MSELALLGNTPVDFTALESLFSDYKSAHNKICAFEKTGKLIRLKKGLYVVSPKETGTLLSVELIANHIYGPSYVSMEFALHYYGLIPESVHIVRSMTTKRSRDFNNTIGLFEYTACPASYFSIGIKQQIVDNTSFLIATPEKALCDLIAYTPNLNLRFYKELRTFLEDDLRFDMNAFKTMDAEIFKSCAETGKKKETLTNILKLVQS